MRREDGALRVGPDLRNGRSGTGAQQGEEKSKEMKRVLRDSMAFMLLAALFVGPTAYASPDPEPPSWSSFNPVSFTNIYLNPSFAEGVLVYDLALGSSPTITIGANTYDVAWIGALFAVGEEPDVIFLASNGTLVTDWHWEYKAGPGGGTIAGWLAEGDAQRLYPLGNPQGNPSSKTFDYGSFDLDSVTVLPGLHVGYLDGGTVMTAFYKVPEPASCIALGAMLLASAATLRRRNR